MNSASQSIKLLKVKKRPNLAPPDLKPSSSALNISEALLSSAAGSTQLPSSKSQIDELWDGIDSSVPIASPNSPSVAAIGEVLLPDPIPSPLTNDPTPQPAPLPPRVSVSSPPPPPPLPAPAVVPVPPSPMPLDLVKEGFVDQMFGNNLKANWKRRHLALFMGGIVFSAVRAPLPKFAKDGSIIGLDYSFVLILKSLLGTEATYLRELGSIRLNGQAGVQVLSSEGEEYGRSYVFTLVTPNRSYVWSAITSEVRNQWVESIRRLVSGTLL